MAELVASDIKKCLDGVSGQRHFDYIPDAYLSVPTFIPCRAWLKIQRDGTTTSKTALFQAERMAFIEKPSVRHPSFEKKGWA
jgi:hypothetical protein